MKRPKIIHSILRIGVQISRASGIQIRRKSGSALTGCQNSLAHTIMIWPKQGRSIERKVSVENTDLTPQSNFEGIDVTQRFALLDSQVIRQLSNGSIGRRSMERSA